MIDSITDEDCGRIFKATEHSIAKSILIDYSIKPRIRRSRSRSNGERY